MSKEILTTKLDGPVPRDAVHVAFVAVQAAYTLKPGDKVALDRYRKAVDAHNDAECVGVVNPFLKETVKRDEWFLLLLNPGSVSNLRHHWDHPWFPEDDSITASDDDEGECRGC